jgi:type II secretory pathway pseudopilin PulG
MMSDNPYESSETSEESPPQRVQRSWLMETLIVVAIVGIFAAFIVPNVRTAREPARRMSCSNNLKHIALAIQNYASVYQALPPAFTMDEEGNPLHSWRTLILPYLEQKGLYDKVDLSLPWDHSANKQVFETSLPVYSCPSATCPATHTTYLAIVTEDSCIPPTGSRALSDITDDHDLTLMVVEVESARHTHWMSPTDISEKWLLNLHQHADHPHPPGIAQAASIGGKVLTLDSDLPAKTLRALISISGNDDELARKAE